MFLVDKYYHDSNTIACHQDILNKILDSFDSHKQIFNNLNTISKSREETIKTLNFLKYSSWQYSNFQHLLVYGPEGNGKEFIVKKLLDKIYGEKGTRLQDIEYTINSYGNTKTTVVIKQSKYHIVIKPNNNGFDKYLIQEILQEYAKTNILTICKNVKLFKTVVIDKIDNLSYYAQASLRRTMEKYANTCKFIFISNQLSKIIEPLKSRSLLVRVPLPNNIQMLNIILNISKQENIELSQKDIQNIILNSDNNINRVIWLLEYKKNNFDNMNNWESYLDKLIDIIFKPIQNNNDIKELIKTIREYFYILYISNIKYNIIIRKLMSKIILKITDYNKIYNIINLTSKYENRGREGSRYIVHIETYILNIVKIINFSG
jgi:replication factor C subunit 3/5